MQSVTFDGLRMGLPTFRAASVVDVDMQMDAPSTERKFLFRLTLVQEGVRWFDEHPQDLFVDLWVDVLKNY